MLKMNLPFGIKITLNKEDDLLEKNQENFRCYINMLQGIIARYSNHSYSIKGWAAAAFGAALGWIITTNKGIFPDIFPDIFPVAILLCFWVLDSYFVQKERTYRNLYTALVSKKACLWYGKSKIRPLLKVNTKLLKEIGMFRLYTGDLERDTTFRRVKSTLLEAMFSSSANGLFYGILYLLWLAYILACCFCAVNKVGYVYWELLIGLWLCVVFLCTYWDCILFQKKAVKPFNDKRDFREEKDSKSIRIFCYCLVSIFLCIMCFVFCHGLYQHMLFTFGL